MRFLLSCLAGAVALALQAAPAAADQVRFQLRDVRIERQREESGDRPYFTALAFRVKLCNRREAPTVEVLEREPHDWVRFSEHNGGRLVTDHMFRGSTVPVPSWMGQYTFNNVNITPISNYIGGGGGRLSDVEILGVVYFSFDNNNTPPHVIRGLMNDARTILQETLRTELQINWRDDTGRQRGCNVLTSALLTGDATALSSNLQTQLQAVAARTIDGWRIAEVLFQLTAGSTFNSDQPTGVNIIMVPSVTGLPPNFGEGLGSAVDYRLPTGSSLFVQTTMMAPANASSRLLFEGAGASYQSHFGLFVTRTSAATTQSATQVWLRIRTGGDDLRGGNDNVFASVRVNGRWRPEVQLNRGGERWADNTTHDVMIPIGSTPVANIEAVRLRTTFGGGMGGDNWNMDSARIDWRGMGGIGGELANQGPKRFTGDDRELVIEFPR